MLLKVLPRKVVKLLETINFQGGQLVKFGYFRCFINQVYRIICLAFFEPA